MDSIAWPETFLLTSLPFLSSYCVVLHIVILVGCVLQLIWKLFHLLFYIFKRGMKVARVIGIRCVTVWLLMFRLLSCVNEFDAKVKSEFFTGKPQSSLPFS